MAFAIDRNYASVFILALVLLGSGCSSDDNDNGNDNGGNDNPGDNNGGGNTGNQNGEGQQPSEKGSFAAPVDSPVLDFSNQRVFWDMQTNSIVGEADDWELSVQVSERNYIIQVNGGASGDKNAGVGVLQVADAYSVTDPSDSDQVYQYFGDTATGVLSTPGDFGPFDYSVEGNHLMWPTYATYLIKDASENFYKFQILSNYGDGSAASGSLVLRYASASTETTTAALDATNASVAAMFDLAQGSQVTDGEWHFAYQRYLGFTTNGGTSGDGGVSGCVASSYPTLYDESGDPQVDAFKSLNTENTLEDFEAVTLDETSCSDGEGMIVDSIATEIVTTDWLAADYSTGSPVFSAITDASNGWIVRSASKDENGDYAYARVKVKDVSVDLSAAPVRQLTLSVESWQENE